MRMNLSFFVKKSVLACLLWMAFSQALWGAAPAYAQAAPAESSILWSDVSLTYLRGTDYELGDPQRNVYTLEVAGATEWAKLFMFVDHLRSDNGDTETYAEISPDFFLQQYTDGAVKHLNIATTVEWGQGFTNYLYGLGAGFNVPGFNYLDINLYRRNNDGLPNNYQLTAVWAYPFKVGQSQWLYDGFVDWASGISGVGGANVNATSQLKLNIAPYINTDTPFYVGIEYVHWRNKYYVDGINENNLNFLLKWHF